MRTVTSVTVFNDAVGKRMSASYSEIDESTGRVVSDNNRVDRVVTDRDMKNLISQLEDYAQTFVDSAE